MDAPWVNDLAASPWLLPALFGLVVGDAFLVILPSETVVVALGALFATTGSPPLLAVLPIAALGAITGDLLCYLIGRRVGLDRWQWQRRGRVARAIRRVRATVHRRTAVLVFTARYIPFARIAVNLAAGAGRVPLAHYLPLSTVAGVTWACYNAGIGALVGAALPKNPLLAVAISIPVAIVLGIVADRIIARMGARHEASTTIEVPTTTGTSLDPGATDQPR